MITAQPGSPGPAGPTGPQGAPGLSGSAALPCTTNDSRCGMFVSSARVNGAMTRVINPLAVSACSSGAPVGTGRACGDDLCNKESKIMFGNNTTWRSWLFETGQNAKNFIQPNASYYVSGSSLVFTTNSDGTPRYDTTWADAIPRLFSIIKNFNQLQAKTGTDSSGVATINNCSNWTDNGVTLRNTVGTTAVETDGWTFIQSPFCNTVHALYCLQVQTP